MAVKGLTVSTKRYLRLLKEWREKVIFKKFYFDQKTGERKKLTYGARCLGLAILDKPPGSKIIYAKLARKFKVPSSLVGRWKKQLVDAGLFLEAGFIEKTAPRSENSTTGT